MNSTVVIIEDDSSNRRILDMAIQGLGLKVFTAVNGEEGFFLAKEKNPQLVILDVMMPKMSGIDTLKKIRSDNDLKNTPVVVVSAKTSEKDANKAFAAGANEFITKPFRIKNLRDVIKKYIKDA